nr:hypothetical protein [Tanacetum cinerariifolium]
MASDCKMKLADRVAMIGGIRSKRISTKLPQPTSTPMPSTPTTPSHTLASWPSMSFMPSAPLRAMLAGIDRSMLPGPVLMTNIWPMPTIAKNVENASAPDSNAPAPCPPVNTSTIDRRTQRQHENQNRALGADLPVRRDADERQQRAGQYQRQRAQHGADGRHAPADEFTATQNHSGDRQQRVAQRHIGVCRRRQSHQKQPRQHTEAARHGVHRHFDAQQRPARLGNRQRVAPGPAQDHAHGRAHQEKMHGNPQHDARDDRQRDQRRLDPHQCLQPLRCGSARRRQQQNRATDPDERHAQRDDNRRQVAAVNQRAEQRIHADAAGQRQPAEKRMLIKQRHRNAGDEADETAHGQVQIVDADDQHLGDGRQRDGHRQLFQLGGVPDERAAARRLLHQDRIHLTLGADVDAAHGVIHEDDLAVGRQGTRKQGFLLVAAGQREDRIAHVGGADAHALHPVIGHGLLGVGVQQQAALELVERADGDVLADGPQREHTIGLPVTGDEAGARAALDAIAQHLGQPLALAMAGETGQADDLPGKRLHGAPVGLPGRLLLHTRAALLPARCKHLSGRLSLACSAAHDLHQRVMGEGARSTGFHHLAVTHHSDAVTGAEHFAENVADQHDAAPALDEAPHMAQQLLGHARVQRRDQKRCHRRRCRDRGKSAPAWPRSAPLPCAASQSRAGPVTSSGCFPPRSGSGTARAPETRSGCRADEPPAPNSLRAGRGLRSTAAHSRLPGCRQALASGSTYRRRCGR